MFSIAYFSPTGNTLHLAKKLEEKLGKEQTKIIDIVSTNPKDLEKNQHLIIMFSVHAFNAPGPVIKFVKTIPSGLYKHVSFIAVGCNETWVNDAASLTLRKILENKGYNILIDEVLAMPLTIVLKLDDEMNNSIIEKAINKISLIGDDLINGHKNKKEISFKSKSINYAGKIEKYAAKLFGLELYANNKCISCGICWEQCPSHNIKQNRIYMPKFGFNCIMCMKCIYDCPVEAIKPRFSKFIPIKGGYSIDDYIKS